MNKKPLSYSILELANVAAGGTIQQTLKDSVTVAQLAEQLGYQRFWLAEHHNYDSRITGANATSGPAANDSLFVCGNQSFGKATTRSVC